MNVTSRSHQYRQNTALPGFPSVCTQTNTTRWHFTVKIRVAAFYGQQLHPFRHSHHTRITTSSHVINIINKETFSFTLTFLLPSSWYDVTCHKDITTSIHIKPLCRAAKTKTILGFKLVFILPSSGYNVTGHEGLTTTTFYGLRVKQKISFRLTFASAT